MMGEEEVMEVVVVKEVELRWPGKSNMRGGRSGARPSGVGL